MFVNELINDDVMEDLPERVNSSSTLPSCMDMIINYGMNRTW